MDKDNKELLEATVKGLQDKINQLNVELKDKQKELEDANKPVVSSNIINIINDTINKAVEDYSFDCGMFEYEFNLCYDNKLELSDLTFTDSYELTGAIVNEIEKQFKIIKDENNSK